MASWAGRIIGAYEIIEPLGQGGMASVFKAYHMRMNRYVALKMIHLEHASDPIYTARFEREAQIIAALDHPNIVPVHDFFEYEGNMCMVMKYIDGMTLRDVLVDGPLRIEDILKVMDSISSAMDFAHERGVLHRDIKPSNILLDMAGTPYISDFGLAKFSEMGETTISQNVMIGTPYYMSPEQAAGSSTITNRSDLYSLGVVLYELILGRVPFKEGTPYAIVHSHIYHPVPLPSSIDPTISPLVEGVLLTALAKTPEDRYPSALAMMDALRYAVEQGLANGQSVVSSSMLRSQDSISRRVAQSLMMQDSRVAPIPRMSAMGESKPSAGSGIGSNSPARTTDQAARTAAAPEAPSIAVSPVLLGVIIAVLILLGGLTMGTLLNGSESPAAPTVPANPVQPTAVQNAAGNGDPSGALLDIPPLTIEQAQAQIAERPDDPALYLALGLAQDAAGQDPSAAFQAGLDAAQDEGLYWASLGFQFAQRERLIPTVESFNLALMALPENDPNRPFVLGEGGRALYDLAINPEVLNPAAYAALEAWYRALPSESNPMIALIMARARIAAGELDSARELLSTLANAPRLGIQVRLVTAELEGAAGNTDQARQLLVSLQASGGQGPPWIAPRIDALLSELQGE
ncbi:MAG: protein kinase [bacterium]|nr:protein kinase [bacterium]